MFGGSKTYRQTIWCSETNNFDNFDLTGTGSSGQVLSTDPIRFTLPGG